MSEDLVSVGEINSQKALMSAGFDYVGSKTVGYGVKEMGVGALFELKGVYEVPQMGSFHPRTVEGVFNYTNTNSRALWNSAGKSLVEAGVSDFTDSLTGMVLP
ncbi:hypothetical protein [Arcanobacterium pinnipediorum]|uniref:Uncharacterized protein n=1 Tax=Arcanobacterium pinnipediorum TaxID=1503041 RepID=A0ABY5AI18_9ACTO|nr:hypothetical protein [Arcanobacterium pinnipediorum]USR79376.1 hypothetical protein NG665_08410 [Arcanobacterium pinnipediorum]